MNIFKHADLSTGHITENDAKILTNNSETNLAPDVVVYEYEYGFFIPILDHMDYKQIRSAGLSEAFVKILKRCKKEGVQLLRLDCDGSEDDKLQKFEW